MSHTLREYVRLLVTEKIRTKKGRRFDIREFKNFNRLDAMLSYASGSLQLAGAGSSRSTFILTPKKVLKIAYRLKRAGVAQNEAEVDAATRPGIKDIIARVYEHDPDYLWLISELVRPLTDWDEFTKLSGCTWEDFVMAMERRIGTGQKRIEHTADIDLDATPEQTPLPARRGKQKRVEKTDSPFIEAIVQFARSGDSLPGDIKKLSSWGKTADGRVVLLDYGATRENYMRFYK